MKYIIVLIIAMLMVSCFNKVVTKQPTLIPGQIILANGLKCVNSENVDLNFALPGDLATNIEISKVCIREIEPSEQPQFCFNPKVDVKNLKIKISQGDGFKKLEIKQLFNVTENNEQIDYAIISLDKTAPTVKVTVNKDINGKFQITLSDEKDIDNGCGLGVDSFKFLKSNIVDDAAATAISWVNVKNFITEEETSFVTVEVRDAVGNVRKIVAPLAIDWQINSSKLGALFSKTEQGQRLHFFSNENCQMTEFTEYILADANDSFPKWDSNWATLALKHFDNSDYLDNSLKLSYYITNKDEFDNVTLQTICSPVFQANPVGIMASTNPASGTNVNYSNITLVLNPMNMISSSGLIYNIFTPIVGGDVASFRIPSYQFDITTSSNGIKNVKVGWIYDFGIANDTAYVPFGYGDANTTFNFNYDAGQPDLTTIARSGLELTNASQVSFTLTFNENVTGGTTADFSFVGTATGSSVTLISGTNKNRVVKVATGANQAGTLSINLKTVNGFKDSANNVAREATAITRQYFNIDRIAPTVSAITLSNSAANNLAEVSFTVTFSESIAATGSAADFSITQTGLTTPSSISSVAGSGTSRVVKVTTGTGTGTLRLDVKANSAFKDAAGNSVVAYSSGSVYNIDKIQPLLTKIERSGLAGTTVSFVLTFDKSVTGGGTSDFVFTGTGTAGASFVDIAGSGTTRIIRVRPSAIGTLSVSLKAANSFRDNIGNMAVESASILREEFIINCTEGDIVLKLYCTTPLPNCASAGKQSHKCENGNWIVDPAKPKCEITDCYAPGCVNYFPSVEKDRCVECLTGGCLPVAPANVFYPYFSNRLYNNSKYWLNNTTNKDIVFYCVNLYTSYVAEIANNPDFTNPYTEIINIDASECNSIVRRTLTGMWDIDLAGNNELYSRIRVNLTNAPWGKQFYPSKMTVEAPAFTVAPSYSVENGRVSFTFVANYGESRESISNGTGLTSPVVKIYQDAACSVSYTTITKALVTTLSSGNYYYTVTIRNNGQIGSNATMEQTSVCSSLNIPAFVYQAPQNVSLRSTYATSSGWFYSSPTVTIDATDTAPFYTDKKYEFEIYDGANCTGARRMVISPVLLNLSNTYKRAYYSFSLPVDFIHGNSYSVKGRLNDTVTSDWSACSQEFRLDKVAPPLPQMTCSEVNKELICSWPRVVDSDSGSNYINISYQLCETAELCGRYLYAYVYLPFAEPTSQKLTGSKGLYKIRINHYDNAGNGISSTELLVTKTECD